MKVPEKLKGFVFESLAETQRVHVRRATVFNAILKITPLRAVLFDVACFENEIYNAEPPQEFYEGQNNFLPLIKVLDGEIPLSAVNSNTVFWLPSEGSSCSLIGLPTNCWFATSCILYVSNGSIMLLRHKEMETPKRLNLSAAAVLLKDSFVSVEVRTLLPQAELKTELIVEVPRGAT